MATLAMINPAKRRKARKASSVKRRANPVKAKRKVSRRRKNPISLSSLRAAGKTLRKYKRHGSRAVRRKNPIALNDLKKLAIPAAIGAVGAVAVSEIMGVLIAKFGDKLPSGLQSGMGKSIAEAAIALGLGYAMDKTKLIKNPSTRNAIVMGALTGIAIKLANDVIVPKLRGASMNGYQMLDVSALNGYQLANAPSAPSLGYSGTAPVVGAMNVSTFRRKGTA